MDPRSATLETTGAGAETPAPTRTTTVALVDDSPPFIQFTRQFLALHGFQIVSAHSNASDALDNILRNAPAVALLDVQLPDLSGIDCARRLKRALPDLAILMLSVHSDGQTVLDSLAAGADGYFAKESSLLDLPRAIRTVQAKSLFLCPIAADRVHQLLRSLPPEDHAALDLTERETEILKLSAKDHADKQIADLLKIELRTVRAHWEHIRERLGVHSRAAAIARFYRAGMKPSPPE